MGFNSKRFGHEPCRRVVGQKPVGFDFKRESQRYSRNRRREEAQTQIEN